MNYKVIKKSEIWSWYLIDFFSATLLGDILYFCYLNLVRHIILSPNIDMCVNSIHNNSWCLKVQNDFHCYSFVTVHKWRWSSYFPIFQVRVWFIYRICNRFKSYKYFQEWVELVKCLLHRYKDLTLDFYYTRKTRCENFLP